MTGASADDWGDFAGDPYENGVAPALYSKGSNILYQARDGAWVPGKVISVDISIVPPSYCVEVEGNLRETEEWRLKDPSSAGLSSAIAATAADVRLPVEKEEFKFHTQPTEVNFNGLGVGQEVKEEEEDFGDFSAASEPLPPPPPSPPTVSSFHSSPSHTPHATSPRPSPSPRTGGGKHSTRDASIDRTFRGFLAAAAPNVAHALEEQDGLERNCIESGGDDFGDFTDAPVEVVDRTEDAFLQRATAATMAAIDAAPAPAHPHPPAGSVVPLSPIMRNLVHLPTSSTAYTDGMAAVAKDSNAVQEYGVAWASILNTGAEILEAARLFWENSFTSSSSSLTKEDAVANSNSMIHLELLEIPRAQRYFAALGRIYYVASLVRLSAEALGLLHFVRELETAWTRCHTAWNSSHRSEIKPLSSVSNEAAKKLGLDYIVNEIERVGSIMTGVLPTLSLDQFPRMLVWSEGLDSILLLPLSIITNNGTGRKGEKKEERGEKLMAAAVVEWPEGSSRRCLAVVANFWLGCVSSVPPELE
ncbi:hypothetical protein Ndes2526B_g08746 [Nannochloris sp. 'desiccata']|nr:hypothetical protein NADE_001459 [Chlorella desiccata (nom. nud.)]